MVNPSVVSLTWVRITGTANKLWHVLSRTHGQTSLEYASLAWKTRGTALGQSTFQKCLGKFHHRLELVSCSLSDWLECRQKATEDYLYLLKTAQDTAKSLIENRTNKISTWKQYAVSHVSHVWQLLWHTSDTYFLQTFCDEFDSGDMSLSSEKKIEEFLRYRVLVYEQDAVAAGKTRQSTLTQLSTENLLFQTELTAVSCC